MVGNSPQRPSLSHVKLGIEGLEAVKWWMENIDALQSLKDDISRFEAAAERAGVGKSLDDARARAAVIVSEAESRARELVSDADRRLAQSEEVLASARSEKAKAEGLINELQDAKELQRRAVEEQNAQLLRRKVELDTRDRKITLAENANKEEEGRLRALRQRLEAALKGP